jgi:hypothetical protein
MSHQKIDNEISTEEEQSWADCAEAEGQLIEERSTEDEEQPIVEQPTVETKVGPTGKRSKSIIMVFRCKRGDLCPFLIYEESCVVESNCNFVHRCDLKEDVLKTLTQTKDTPDSFSLDDIESERREHFLEAIVVAKCNVNGAKENQQGSSSRGRSHQRGRGSFPHSQSHSQPQFQPHSQPQFQPHSQPQFQPHSQPQFQPHSQPHSQYVETDISPPQYGEKFSQSQRGGGQFQRGKGGQSPNVAIEYSHHDETGFPHSQRGRNDFSQFQHGGNDFSQSQRGGGGFQRGRGGQSKHDGIGFSQFQHGGNDFPQSQYGGNDFPQSQYSGNDFSQSQRGRGGQSKHDGIGFSQFQHGGNDFPQSQYGGNDFPQSQRGGRGSRGRF